MASRLYPHFIECWKHNTITEGQLQAAVNKGYLTEQEKQDIIATPIPA